MENDNGSHAKGGIPGWVKGGCLAGVVGGIIVIVAPVVFSTLIIAPMAMKNISKSQKRAHVSRALSDMRSMETALEAYYVDNQNVYPPSIDKSISITTPISYLRALPIDPFRGTGSQIPYQYFTVAGDYIIFSVGPDGDADIKSASILKNGLALLDKTYDATNGTVSNGDLFRLKHNRRVLPGR